MKTYEPKPLFIERMKKILGKDIDKYLKALKDEPVKSLRANTLKISPGELKKRFEEKSWKIKQPFKKFPEIMIVEGKYTRSASLCSHMRSTKVPLTLTPPLNLSRLTGSHIDKNDNAKAENLKSTKFDNVESASAKRRDEVQRRTINERAESEHNLIDLEPGELGRSVEHLLGYYYIQEISSMLPVLVLNPKPNQIILDLCAAPGSKTTQIAARMKNTGTIIANDLKLGRIKILASNLERCGVTNTIITKSSGESICKKLKENNFKVDKILIDAPCSGEGTIRGTPKTLKMWNIKKVHSLSRIQKSLLSNAIELLENGNKNGEIVYSTCTYAPEENEGVLDFVLKKYKNVKIERLSLPIELKSREGIKKWQEREYLEEIKYSCRIYPQDNNTEGFFIAKLKVKRR